MSQKWKAFENNVAKSLSQWLFGEEKVLRRTPCSGGWKGRGTGGDIALVDTHPELREDLLFAFEAKCRSSRGSDTWHFEQLLTSPKHQILDWWYQLSDSDPVVKEKKLRMLIFSKTSGIAKAYVALGEREVEFIEDAGLTMRALPKIVFEVGRCEDPGLDTEILHFFCFREFVAYLDPQPLKELWRRRNGDA